MNITAKDADCCSAIRFRGSKEDVKSIPKRTCEEIHAVSQSYSDKILCEALLGMAPILMKHKKGK